MLQVAAFSERGQSLKYASVQVSGAGVESATLCATGARGTAVPSPSFEYPLMFSKGGTTPESSSKHSTYSCRHTDTPSLPAPVSAPALPARAIRTPMWGLLTLTATGAEESVHLIVPFSSLDPMFVSRPVASSSSL